MVADGFFFDPIWDFLLTNPIFRNSVIGISLLTNAYLFKKFKEYEKAENGYVDLLKKIEPLLEKIINKEKFKQTEINVAEKVVEIIKFELHKHVR